MTPLTSEDIGLNSAESGVTSGCRYGLSFTEHRRPDSVGSERSSSVHRRNPSSCACLVLSSQRYLYQSSPSGSLVPPTWVIANHSAASSASVTATADRSGLSGVPRTTLTSGGA